MTDIVERLRSYIPGEPAHEECVPEVLELAAREIERLRNVSQSVPKVECEYCKQWHDPRLACPEYVSLSSAQCGEAT